MTVSVDSGKRAGDARCLRAVPWIFEVREDGSFYEIEVTIR
jgi:hypothetical protein